MAVHLGSRYAQSSIIPHVDKDKGLVPLLSRRTKFIPPSDAQYINHEVVNGDTLDFLAYKYLYNPNYWWVILDCNSQFFSPWEIKPGTILRIPTPKTLRSGLNAV